MTRYVAIVFPSLPGAEVKALLEAVAEVSLRFGPRCALDEPNRNHCTTVTGVLSLPLMASMRVS